MGLSGSPLTPRGCRPQHRNQYSPAGLCVCRGLPASAPGSSASPAPPAAGGWRWVSIRCLDQIVREGGLRGERPVPAEPAHPSASSRSSHKPSRPLLSCFRASGSRWSLPGSRRSCIRPHSRLRTHTRWKRPSRRPWRWPAGCTRRGLLLLLLPGSPARRASSGFKHTCYR